MIKSAGVGLLVLVPVLMGLAYFFTRIWLVLRKKQKGGSGEDQKKEPPLTKGALGE